MNLTPLEGASAFTVSTDFMASPLGSQNGQSAACKLSILWRLRAEN